uniref:Uncharacterized protein n=1 Tax=Monodelphis domestica TaxID=13616 RepID=A0A5F8GU70_MONDO
MINYPVWISPSGQELCTEDSKNWTFKSKRIGSSTKDHLSIKTDYIFPGESMGLQQNRRFPSICKENTRTKWEV